MNVLSGTIKSIQNHGNLSLVMVSVSEIDLTSIVIETPDSVDYLKIGTAIRVMFKETEVIMARKGDHAISLQNQIPVSLLSIKKGVLLSELTLDFQGNILRSIITTRAVNNLGLAAGDKVMAMIKTNELMLAK